MKTSFLKMSIVTLLLAATALVATEAGAVTRTVPGSACSEMNANLDVYCPFPSDATMDGSQVNTIYVDYHVNGNANFPPAITISACRQVWAGGAPICGTAVSGTSVSSVGDHDTFVTGFASLNGLSPLQNPWDYYYVKIHSTSAGVNITPFTMYGVGYSP